jgi:tRNA dimethylallyltransferase
MFANGVVEEVAAVTTISPTAEQMIGFRQIRSLLAGKIDEATCIHRIRQMTRNYAKRQMTWFRNRGYEPVDIHAGQSSFIESLSPRDVGH